MTSSTESESMYFARLGTDASHSSSAFFPRMKGNAKRVKLVVNIRKSRQELALNGEVEKGDLI